MVGDYAACVSRLNLYVEGWREAATDLRTVAAELGDKEWDAATDCPGWTVRDVLAHVVALEEHLAGIDFGSSDVVGSSPVVTPEWTEEGVEARRGRTVADLLSDLDGALAAREEQLSRELAGAEPGARAPRVPASLAWDWDTLLRNRAIDMWVHGQDIRRAVGRPGGLGNRGAAVTLAAFTQALPFVLGKKVRPPTGTSVVWEVTGAHEATVALGIDEAGRAVPLTEAPSEPTTRLAMDIGTFTALLAGRGDPSAAPVRITGDTDLGRRTIAAMAVTP
jgi:uncharacterized protein (TIGR03083 family)